MSTEKSSALFAELMFYKSGIARTDSLDIAVFGQMLNDIRVGDLPFHIQRIEIGKYIMVALVFHMEVNVKHFDLVFFKVFIDIGKGLQPMDKGDLNGFKGLDSQNLLQNSQRDQNDDTADTRKGVAVKYLTQSA